MGKLAVTIELAKARVVTFAFDISLVNPNRNPTDHDECDVLIFLNLKLLKILMHPVFALPGNTSALNLVREGA